MRRVRYSVATSLDGYIAGPQGEADWIIMDPEIDFDSYMREFDTIIMGRRTFEPMAHAGGGGMPGVKTYVSSRTLRQADFPNVTIVADAEQTASILRAGEGKDIWLFGGGTLFRTLLEAGLVDSVEVALIPVLLGAGIPLLPSPASHVSLQLTGHHVYKTGVVGLNYSVQVVPTKAGTRIRK
jgi:dihydrofolate reductase